jgi:predicted RNA-binding Zn ribbon-like protein
MSRPDGSPAAAAQRAAALVAVLRPGEPGVAVQAGEVIQVLRAHGEPGPIELADADVAAMRAVAGELHAVFAATDTAAAAGSLNKLLARTAAPPQLSDHGKTPWHIHFDPGGSASWAQWLATSSALALAALLSSRQSPPGGLCASASCRRPFADLGRGAARRYCSARCASRARVAAHRRARQAAPGPGRDRPGDGPDDPFPAGEPVLTD